jgi:transcriptional regulator with XRE-family HTH domain
MESGVSQHTISEIELGRRKPHGRTLRKLAGVLGIDVADFYQESDAPKAQAPSQRSLFNGATDERRITSFRRAASHLEEQVEHFEAKLTASALTGEDRVELDKAAALITPLLPMALEAEASFLRELYPDEYDVGPHAVLGPVIVRFVTLLAEVEGEPNDRVRELKEIGQTAYTADAA